MKTNPCSCSRSFASGIVLLMAAVTAPLVGRGQTDNFNSGNDSAWAHYDLSAAGLPPSSYSFTNDGAGGYAYRIVSPAPPVTAYGQARALSYRTNTYSDFFVEADVVAWDDTLHQNCGVVARVASPGLGTATGYLFIHDRGNPASSTTGGMDIVRLDGEVPHTLPLTGTDAIHFVPGKSYRLMFTGVGNQFRGRVYELPDLSTPVVDITASDATYGSGMSGLVVVDNSGTFAQPADATFDNYSAQATPAPAIFLQPQSATNAGGASTSFAVAAGGGPPLGYQWQFYGTNFANGGRISGANTDQLAIANVQLSDAGNYRVVVTNAYGSATSAVAVLTVSAPNTNWTWNGSASTDWFNPNNWTPVGVPAPNDTVNFTNGTINLTAPVTFGGQFNWSGGTLSGSPMTLLSNAQFNVTGAANLSGTLNGSNTVVGISGTTASLTLNGGDIRGGTVVATNGAGLVVNGSGTLDGLTVNGVLDVGNSVNGAALTVVDGLVLNGMALVGSRTNNTYGVMNFTGSQSLSGQGSVVLGAGYVWCFMGCQFVNNVLGLATGTTLTIGPGVTVRGQNGSIGNGNGPVINQGTISADVSGGTLTINAQSFSNQGTVSALLGTLNFNNGLVLNGGTLSFGLSGPSSFGRITVSGAANLGGGVSAVLLGGYVPDIGATFDVMTFGSTNGTFTDYSGLNVGSGRVLVPLLSSTKLTLQAQAATCPTITLSPASLPGATVGVVYSQSLTATGGVAPYNFARTGGSLPAGLNLATNGVISGSPTGAGTNTFTVTATDTNGCPGSNSYTMVVGSPPSITAQPQSITNAVGTMATFSVTAAGTLPLSYQWQFNGTNLTDSAHITGAQSNSLVIANVQTGDAGNYQVLVTNAYGSVTSQVAVLTVILPQGNLVLDGSFEPPSIPAGGRSTGPMGAWYMTVNISAPRVYTAGAATGANATDGVQALDFGYDPYGYLNSISQVLPTISGQSYLLSFDWGSELNQGTTGRVVVGNLDVQLTDPPGISGATWIHNQTNLVFVANGNDNLVFTQISDDNWGFCLDNVRVIALSSQSNPPAITLQPSNRTNVVGTTASFSIAATGTSPLNYQWQFNGTNLTDSAHLTGSQTNRLTIVTMQATDAGGYQVVVTNAYGSVTSAVAVLAVTPASLGGLNYEPALGTLPPAQGFTLVDNGIAPSATVSGGLLHQDTSGDNAARQWWYAVSSNAFDFATGFTLEANLKVISSSYNPAAGSGGKPRAGCGFGAYDDTGRSLSIAIASGGLWLDVSDNAESWGITAFTAFDTTRGFNHYRLVTQGGTATLFINGAAFLSIPLGPVLDPTTTNAVSFGENTQYAGSQTELAWLRATAGAPPNISVQPQSQSVGAGTNASFSVVAVGTSPLSYQWQSNGTNLTDSAHITGSQSNSLVIANVQSGDAGNYQVLVSNAYGSAASAMATLTVLMNSTHSGRIVVAWDDWVLSGTGFGSAPDAATFARNVAAWLTSGRAGRFLASSAFSLGGSQVATALTSAGHTWVLNNSIGSLSLSNLLTYDALFLGDTVIDNTLLTEYVAAGGNIYVYGIGYGDDGTKWNGFLETFGLTFAGLVPTTGVLAITNSVHPIFSGVTNLYGAGGAGISVTRLGDPRTQVLTFDSQGMGLFGVWDPGAGSNSVSTPMILVQPLNATNVPGTTATFAMVAAGALPLWYQWQFNGTNLTDSAHIIGSQSNNLAIVNVQLGDVGIYQVFVTKSYGSVTSAVATLSVGSGTLLRNGGFENGLAGWTVQGSETTTPSSTNPPPIPDSSGDTGLATIMSTLAGSPSSPTTDVLPMEGANFALISNGGPSRTATKLSQTFSVPGNPGNLSFNYRFLTTEQDSGATWNDAFVAQLNSNTVIRVTRNDLQPGGVGALTPAAILGVGGYAMGTAWRSATVDLTPYAGQTVTLSFAVWDVGDASSDTAVALDGIVAGGAYPIIVSQPTNQVVPVGGTAVFAVQATGSTPLNYQWQCNGTNLSDNAQVIGSHSNMLSIGSVLATNAGSYAVVVSNAFGTTLSQLATLGVIKFTPVLTWGNPAPILYGTALDTNQLNATLSVTGNPVYNPPTGTVLPAGNNLLSVLFTPTDLADYNAVTGSVSLVVLRAPLRVSANNLTRRYGATNPIFSVTIIGSANGDNLTGSYALAATAGSPVGVYPVVPLLLDPGNRLPNYTVITNNGSLWITNAPLAVTAANVTRPYGQTNPPLGGTISGLQNGDNITANYTCSATASSPAGTYLIVPSLVDPNNRLPNYLATTNAGTLTVTPPPPPTMTSVTPNVGPTSGGTTVAIRGTGFESGATVNFGAWAATNVSVLNASNLTAVTPAALAGLVNVVLTNGDGQSITLSNGFTYVPVTLIANGSFENGLAGWTGQGSQTVTGSATNPPPIPDGSGDLGLVTTLSLLAGVPSSPATDVLPVEGTNFALIANGGPGRTATRLSQTFSVPGNPGNLSFNYRFLTTEKDSGANWNDAFVAQLNSNTVVRVTRNDLQPGGVGALSPTAVAGVGGYPMGTAWRSVSVDLSPYAGQTVTLSFTVWDVGDANSDTVVALDGIAAGGAYPIIVTQPTNQVVPVGGNAAFAVQATGSTPLSYQWQFNGTNLTDNANVIGSHSNVLSLGSVGASNAGSYAVVVSNALGTASSQTATLNVVKVTPGLNWSNPAPILYGTALSTNQLNASVTPGVPGSFNYTPTNGAVLSAGTNALTVTFTPTDSLDYNAVTGGVSLVVLRAPLRATANNLARMYGATNPTFTVTIVGVQNGDSLAGNYTVAATPASSVGVYPVVPWLSDPGNRLSNYNVTTNNGTLSITNAPLAVTATNVTRLYGQSNLALGGIIAGLQNSDNITANYTCSATPASPVGPYAIIPSLLDPNNRLPNYAVTTNSGTLTVAKAPTTLAWTNPAPVSYGAALGTNQLNAVPSVPATPAYTPATGTVLNAGTNVLSVVFTPADTTNYSGAIGSVSLVVLRAPLSVTASNAARLSGQANPAFGGTVLGLTNGDSITANYTCSATVNSPAGTYAIVPSLVDPNNRLPNYVASTNNGMLTVTAGIQVHDDAGPYYAAGNWTSGMNFGFGLQPWVITTSGSAHQGVFIGDGGNIATTNNSAWGLYANGTPTNVTVAYRGFSNSLPIGLAFKLQWRSGNIGNNPYNFAGFSLRTGNASANTSAYTNGERLSFFYQGGGLDDARLRDGDGTVYAPTPGITFSNLHRGVALEITLLSSNSYRLAVMDAATTNLLALFDNRLLAGTGTIQSLALYDSQTDPGLGEYDGNQLFNNLEISTLSTPLPPVVQVLRTGGSISLSWSASLGNTYQVQYKTNLSQVSWQNLGGTIAATNAMPSVTDAIGPDRQRFYRVILLP